MSDASMPWFPLYPGDFISSQTVAAMSTEAIGAYVLLLCYAWGSQDCGIPDDDARLERLTRAGKRWPEIRDQVMDAFVEHPEKPGRLVNPRLYAEWQKSKERLAAKARAGEASGKARRRASRSGDEQTLNRCSTDDEQEARSVRSQPKQNANGRRGVLPTLTSTLTTTALPTKGRAGLLRSSTAARGAPSPAPPSESGDELEPNDVRSPDRRGQFDADDWRISCLCADLVEEHGSGQLVGAGEVRRAMAFAYLVEAGKKDVSWQSVVPTLAAMARSPLPEVQNLLRELRRFPDGALPGRGNQDADPESTPNRLQQAARLLKAASPSVRLYWQLQEPDEYAARLRKEGLL